MSLIDREMIAAAIIHGPGYSSRLSDLIDSGTSRGRKTANNAGPYTTLRIIRHDRNQLAIKPSKISPTANMQHVMVLPKTRFLTPAISTPANELLKLTEAAESGTRRANLRAGKNETRRLIRIL